MTYEDTWFEDEVFAALDALPPEFADALANIEVAVAPRPSPEQRRVVGIRPWQTLYGLYEGIPLPARSSGYNLVQPDRITIFTEPLERDFPSEESLRAQIHRTVRHEIAHFFGISDDRLRDIGAY
jgi:predicted Zn-dependent protease with MMP-like domain